MKNLEKFKAAMFDFDGTVTEKGSIAPSAEMAKFLYELACRMPIAFCTGRQKSSFEARPIFSRSSADPTRLFNALYQPPALFAR